MCERIPVLVSSKSLSKGCPTLTACSGTKTRRVLRSTLAAPQDCRVFHASHASSVFGNLKFTSFLCIKANNAAMRRTFSSENVGEFRIAGFHLSRTSRLYSDWQRYRRRYRRFGGCGRLSERCRQRGAVDRGRRQPTGRSRDRNSWHAFLFSPQQPLQLHLQLCE
jgi:hypothetical protein